MTKSVVVFASTQDGKHIRGVALEALHRHGATPGISQGLQGDCFAVPLFDSNNAPIPPDAAAAELVKLLQFAESHKDIHFDASRLEIPQPAHPVFKELFHIAMDVENVTLPQSALRVTQSTAQAEVPQPQSTSGIHIVVPDGTSILRRVYEANRQVPNDIDRAAGAVRSALYSLRRAILEHRPTHFVVAMDGGSRNTFRHAAYPEYKAHREESSPALKAALNVFEAMLIEAGILTVRPTDVEADDIIASIGHRSASKGLKCTVLSSDKDSIWLSSLGVIVHHHFDKVNHDEAYCLTKYGIPTARFIDYLSLVGDVNDGIPGVPGIGPKTAKDLILAFPDLRSIAEAAAAGEIKGAKGASIKENQEMLEMSKFLATPKLNCDIGFKNLNETKLKVDPVTIWANLNPDEIKKAIEKSAHDFHPENKLPTESKPQRMKP